MTKCLIYLSIAAIIGFGNTSCITHPPHRHKYVVVEGGPHHKHNKKPKPPKKPKKSKKHKRQTPPPPPPHRWP